MSNETHHSERLGELLHAGLGKAIGGEAARRATIRARARHVHDVAACGALTQHEQRGGACGQQRAQA